MVGAFYLLSLLSGGEPRGLPGATIRTVELQQRGSGRPLDDVIVWRLLGRFQILVFDFESPGSDYEHRARERSRLALTIDQANRAADLWPVLIDLAGACARAAGAHDRPAVVTPLEAQHGFH